MMPKQNTWMRGLLARQMCIFALALACFAATAADFEITVMRQYPSKKCTSGYLAINHKIICYTLERPWNDNAKNLSSIPQGKYSAILRYDKKDHWRIQLENVPHRSGIQIHIGNEVDESKGCILVGDQLGADLCSLKNSAAAYANLKTAFYGSHDPSVTPDKNITVKIIDAGSQ